MVMHGRLVAMITYILFIKSDDINLKNVQHEKAFISENTYSWYINSN